MPVHLDQKGCQYIPHVVVMHAGQSLEIANNDQTSHNIHPLPTKNPEWNKSQPPGSPPIVTKYDNPDFIPVKCNVHPWMQRISHRARHVTLRRIPAMTGRTRLRDSPGGSTRSPRGTRSSAR